MKSSAPRSPVDPGTAVTGTKTTYPQRDPGPLETAGEFMPQKHPPSFKLALDSTSQAVDQQGDENNRTCGQGVEIGVGLQ